MTDEPDSVDELISRYLDGEATDAEIARVESEPALAARAESMRAAIEAVAAPVEIPTARLDAIRAVAIAESATTEQVTDLMAAGAARAEKLQRRSRLMAIAAAFVFLAVGVVAIQNLSLGGDDDDDTTTESSADSSDDAASDDGDSDEMAEEEESTADALSTQAGDGDDMERMEEDADMADDEVAEAAPVEETEADDEAIDEEPAEEDMAEEEAAPLPFAATDLLPDELPPAATPAELVESIVAAYDGQFDAEGAFGGGPDEELLAELCPAAIDLAFESLPDGVVSIERALVALDGVEVTGIVAAGVDGTLAVLTHPIDGCDPVEVQDIVTVN